MKNLIKLLSAVLVFLLALCLVLPQTQPFPVNPSDPTEQTKEMASTTVSTETSAATEIPTQTLFPTETSEPETEAPTETQAPTVPAATTYVISFAGDCTFADNLNTPPETWGTFTKVVGDNFAYPFALVKDYFANDDLSLINLEFAFTTYDPTEEEIKHFALHEKTFRFRADSKYTQVLHEGAIECVSAANNHSKDFANPGHEETKAVLTAAGIRAKLDDRNETLKYRIREAQLEKIPYMLVVGEKEKTDGTVAVRARKEEDGGVMKVDDFMAKALMEIATKKK